MNVTIRKANHSDAADISAIVTFWAHHYLENPGTQEAAQYLATLEAAPTAERINAPDFSYFVAEDDTGICGYIALREAKRIHHLFIHADHGGRGIARALWEHAKATSGSSEFFVNSSPPAVPVYARFGFVTTGSQQMKNGMAYVPMHYQEGLPSDLTAT
jgi:GNAT superfamily N-acetyltransferase